MDLGPINVAIEGGMCDPFPPLMPVAQHFDRPRVRDVAAAMQNELANVDPQSVTGKRIAITGRKMNDCVGVL